MFDNSQEEINNQMVKLNHKKQTFYYQMYEIR